MNKKLLIIGIVFVVIIGSLWHFIYEWSGENFWVGLIAPINESVWEHMKLVFFPILLFAAVEYYLLRKTAKNFFFALLIEQLLAILFIIAFFYIYNLFTKESILILDILSFVLAIIIAKLVFSKLIIKKSGIRYEQASKVLIIFLLLFFFYSTISPPYFSLFRDPVNGTYGIQK